MASCLHCAKERVYASLGLCVHMNACLPGAILCAAVDVSPIIQQVLDYAEPATGARLMKSTVASVVSVIHLADSVLQTVQHHLLKQKKKRANTEGEQGLACRTVFLLNV